MKHSTGKPTKADKARFEALKSIGCIACNKRLFPTMALTDIEIHHLLSGNRRIGHQATIPLCTWHHRGQIRWTKRDAEALLGPSLANGSKPFHASFGSDQELLAETNAFIKEGYVK